MNARRRTMALSTSSFAADEARPPRARPLVVTVGNTAAERLYEKLGFQDIARP